ncbi:reverse transcriptase [Gossypium australe]|uniref:Reverse transcriptase n=1 Tax=Gossypium australe TaxID=47621 RepID=A0A5B6UF02_9ROSI|nr:reverse transcriptase [Gossypium australe]
MPLRSTDVRCYGTEIGTWEEFYSEFKAQFYLEYVEDESRAKLRWLTQQGIVREYGQERGVLFLYGWIEAISEVRVATLRSSRACQSHGNGEGDKDKSAKNGDSKAQKPWDGKKNGPLTCFLCDGPCMIKDYSEKVTLSIMEANEEEIEVTKNINLILGGVEDKISHGLMFLDITMTGRRLNALVDIGALDLFMSKETVQIEKESGWIKIANSKSVKIEGVAKGVEIQLGEWIGKDTIKVIPVDDFDFMVGLSFLDWINASIFPFYNYMIQTIDVWYK